jgi:hypothetical protein
VKLKLDENFGQRCVSILRDAGHDAMTVVAQQMSGYDDHRLIAACNTEGRCLVSLDLDFANPLRFNPADYRGIAVFRLPRRPAYTDMEAAARMLCRHLASADITGKLWVVEHDRVREYQPDQ